MRTASKEKLYTCVISGDVDWFREQVSKAQLCAGAVRDAFHIPRAKKVKFLVTNSKPKHLADWHIIRKSSHCQWTVTSLDSIHYGALLESASRVLIGDFPKNSTLYVCAY